jgi:hypothetical protein
MSRTEWETAPMRVTPIRFPFSSAGVFMSGLVISRCSPLLTTLATMTVSPPRNEAATRTSPAEFTICTSLAMSALMPAVPPWPVTITSGSMPCLRKSPFVSATHTAVCKPLTELNPILTLSCAMARQPMQRKKTVMAHTDVFRFIATVLRLALAQFRQCLVPISRVDILRGYSVSTVALAMRHR